MISLMHFCDGDVLQEVILEDNGFESKLMDARTVAFISLVLFENVRAYTSRSFDKPFWQNFLGNIQMQKAIIMAQLCLCAAVFLPGLSDAVLGLRGIHIGWWGWGVAMIGPLATVVLCEACKLVTHCQVRRYQAKLARAAESESKVQPAAMGEIKVDVVGISEELVRQCSKKSYE